MNWKNLGLIANPFRGLNGAQKFVWWWTLLFVIPTSVAGIVYNVRRHDLGTCAIIAVYLAFMVVYFAASFSAKGFWYRSHE